MYVYFFTIPKTQNAYKHLIIEHQILEKEGHAFKMQIRQLKQNGYKTEPAFAKLLGLKCNPYQALLEVVV